MVESLQTVIRWLVVRQRSVCPHDTMETWVSGPRYIIWPPVQNPAHFCSSQHADKWQPTYITTCGHCYKSVDSFSAKVAQRRPKLGVDKLVWVQYSVLHVRNKCFLQNLFHIRKYVNIWHHRKQHMHVRSNSHFMAIFQQAFTKNKTFYNVSYMFKIFLSKHKK